MAYSNEEQCNRDAVKRALNVAAIYFANPTEVFADDIKWTITGYSPVARIFNGIKDLLDNGKLRCFIENPPIEKSQIKMFGLMATKCLCTCLYLVRPLAKNPTIGSTCIS